MADRILLGGAPEGFDATLLARELHRGQSVIHVARDDKRMEAVRAALAVIAPEAVVLDLPAWDCLPYDRVSPNPDVLARRMATLAVLAGGVPGPFVLLTTLNAATQRLPAREVIAGASFVARVGDRVDEAHLRSFLARMGFSPVSTVAEPGDFAIRGGIVDIFPPGSGGPVRLDLFGDVLDGARRFDPATQRTTAKLKAVDFAPMSEIILDEAAITRFRQNYRVEFGTAGSDDPLYEAVSAGRKHQGMEHWLPFFHARMETLFDYLPTASVMLDDQVTAAARRCQPRGGSAPFTNRLRRGCCIWTTRLGNRRLPRIGWYNFRPCHKRRGRGFWTHRGGSGAALPQNASRKTSVFSGR